MKWKTPFKAACEKHQFFIGPGSELEGCHRCDLEEAQARIEALEWLVEVLVCHPRKTDGDTDLKRFYAACDELAATQSAALAATEASA